MKLFMYRPIAQSYDAGATLLIQTKGDPLHAIPAVRAAVRQLNPDLAISNTGTLDSVTKTSLLPLKISAALAGVLGAVALVLGAIGIYGVMSYLVRQRNREIGIRIAMGASPVSVVRLVTGQAMRWTMTGLGVGLLLAVVLGQLLISLVYGVVRTDFVAFAGISLLLSATAFAAAWFPARRASRIDPLSALRDE
jgi:ABC-type antimicrobial peptide transport system permease subunit